MFKRLIVRLVLVTFFFTSLGPVPNVSAQTMLDLPAPGIMVNTSISFEPLQLKGILVNIKNPLRFDFLVDKGDSNLYGQPLKDEIIRLSKYFLTCLTVPEDDLWVNLSPYEKDRIVPNNFGVTLMGKDLLEQDYLLKQIMASLSYPENDLGKKFWQRVYRRSYELYGTTEIPINTFNKVWIIPKSAEVYARGNSAFVVNSQLDVMLEADYKAFVHHVGSNGLKMGQGFSQNAGAYSQIFRDVILPELRQEVNEGKNFALVRQVYNALILATWYKRHLKDSLLGRMYVGQNKVAGVDIADKNAKEKIFRLYLKAYKKCVYNYIKEDYDPFTQQTLPRKYASGGMYFAGFGHNSGQDMYREVSNPRGMKIGTDLAMATVDVTARDKDGGIVQFPYWKAEVLNTHPFHEVPLEAREEYPSAGSGAGNSAMITPKFLRTWMLPLVLAVAGFAITPTMASAAAPLSPPGNISVNTPTSSVIQMLDKQTDHYKKSIQNQESLLNFMGILGDPEDSNRIEEGLRQEDTQARSLLVSGKTVLDQPAVISLEISRLSGEIRAIDRQIATHRQKLNYLQNEVTQRMHSSQKVGAVLPQDVGWQRHLIKGLMVRRNERTNKINELSSSLTPQVVPAATTAPVKVSVPAIVHETLTVVHEAPPQVPVKALELVNPVKPAVLPKINPADLKKITDAVSGGVSSIQKELTAFFATEHQAAPHLTNVQQSPSTQPGPSTRPAEEPSPQPLPQQGRASDSNASSGGIPPPPPPKSLLAELLDSVQSDWPWYGGFATLGIGVAAAGISSSKRKKSLTLAKPGDRSASSPLSSAIGKLLLPNAAGLLDVTLPPPAVSTGEKEVLASNLAKLRQLAQGIISPPPSMPVQDERPGQNLAWMSGGAFLAGLGVSLFFSGGLSALTLPLLTGAFYIGQKWIHEIFFHLAPALGLYPTKIKTTLSADNLRGHLSLGQWLKNLIPFSWAQRSYVDLPFAKAEGNGWNRARNKIIARSGFVGSTALALIGGYFIGWTPLLIPWIFSAAAVLKGSWDSGDVLGSQDTDEGIFGCGILGYIKSVSSRGISKKDMQSWTTWFFKALESSTARGGQQAGVSTNFSGANGVSEQLDQKITKSKRNWILWKGWEGGPVFYRNMIQDLHSRFYKALPEKLVPVYNYAKVGVLKFLGHVRFATGGDMVENAAHPQSSPEEERELYVYDGLHKMYKKVIRFFNMTSAFNGDTDSGRLGLKGSPLFNQPLSFRQMRTFFSAAVHSYYDKRVTVKYLKKTVNRGTKYKQKVTTNYPMVLKALRLKGYITLEGYVNRRFTGLDEEFKSWFPDYREEVFNEIECALFGIPPGDAPINPRVMHLLKTKANWFASVRYAHVMVNHQNTQETRKDILLEKEGRAVGRIFTEVFDQVLPYLSRPGYVPGDPDALRSVSDMYVKDEQTARQLGLEDQYQMLQVFKQMLDKRIQQEAQRQTVAGEVFRHWQQEWQAQGVDAEHMRHILIDVAVEKFFTGDSVATMKEFAERMEGTFGLFMEDPTDDSVTLYQNNQDVVVGINRQAGVIAFGSDPRSLKTVGPNGEKVNEIMNLQDNEVVNLSFSASGEVIVKSWIRNDDGQWDETSPEEIEKRFYPNEEYVNGIKNPYYAPPPIEYESPHRIVQEDLKNTSRILAEAQTELENPNSFNRQSTDNLALQIHNAIKRNGRARLVVIGYDNSRKISEQLKQIAGNLIDKTKLDIEVLDANKFNETPSAFNINPDDIVMIVSKSGATFSSKLALRIVKKLVSLKNIFCMTARIDSVLVPLVGQGLRPTDEFTKRVFVTGEFYPAETPVASEVLLEFQMQQLALNLTRSLGDLNDPENTMGVKFSAERLQQVSQRITHSSILMAQQLTGFDTKGKEYAAADKDVKGVGTYLGKAALEPWKVSRVMDVFLTFILACPPLLLTHWTGLWGVLPDVIWIKYVVPFLVTEFHRKIIKRHPYGRNGNFDLFIAAPPMIASTQRNFFSRILTNRLKTIGPGAIYGENPTEDFVASHASDQKRGDINLKFSLDHKIDSGRMGVSQATFPQTAIFGVNGFKGRPEFIDIVVKLPLDKDASVDEINLMDDTLGALGLMLAAKTIGVEMARVASFDGRLFNLSSTFSSAGVHTTLINPISEDARRILNSRKEDDGPQDMNAGSTRTPSPEDFPDDFDVDIPLATKINHAMLVQRPFHKNSRDGGIDMNSRLMQLKIISDGPVNAGDKMQRSIIVPVIRGVDPNVAQVVPVTPEMLKTMLGVAYLN